MYSKKLSAEKVFLCPTSDTYVDKFVEWVNDIEAMFGTRVLAMNINYKKEEEILNKLSKSEYHFTIFETYSKNLIGSISLNEFSNVHKTGELGIIIGDKSAWGKGYGYEAMNLFLDYVFNVVNMHKISLSVCEFNVPAYNLYKKVGFKDCGRLREEIMILGKRYDLVFMDILSSEFESKLIKNTFFNRFKG